MLALLAKDREEQLSLTGNRCAQGKSYPAILEKGHVVLTRAFYKTHRRDQFIEWIKGLLAVPFVLNSQPAAAYEDDLEDKNLATMASTAHQRYADIFRDVEALIVDHRKKQDTTNRSKLVMLCPTISAFFTPLALEAAFKYQDGKRAISSRRFVPPSFNDIRLILNSSQIISLMTPQPTIELITFDGDVTLYDDGGSLSSPEADPVIQRLIHFLSKDICIGIVTAAGYTDPARYYDRLSGLLDAVFDCKGLSASQKTKLIVMGGESNFLFTLDPASSESHHLRQRNRRSWILPTMQTWSEPAIQSLLDVGESAFRSCLKTLNLPADILRKERAVGIIPQKGKKLPREQLEETVLVVQQLVELSCSAPDPTPSDPNPTPPIHAHIPFTTFNGGSDVFLDVGDKSLGVQACQKWFGGIRPERTLHVGDQFLSGGGNDFKARNACTTAWIASPEETLSLLDEIIAQDP